jgi:hypothetical protein
MPTILKRLKYGRAIEGTRPEIRVIAIKPGVSRSENMTAFACCGVAKKFNDRSTVPSIECLVVMGKVEVWVAVVVVLAGIAL